MFETDVSALGELLDRMMECHRQLGTLDSFSTGLNSMGDLVDHPRWKQRVIYEKALSALGSSWNEDAGRPILATLGPIENVDDSEILELYLDLEGDRLGFAKRMALIDRIVVAGRSAAVRLQYRGVRALQLMLIGDQDGCVAELQSAVSEYRERAGRR